MSEQSCLGPEQQQEDNSKNNGLSLTNNVNLKNLTVNSKNQMPRPNIQTKKNLK